MTTLGLAAIAIVGLSWLIQLLHSWRHGGRLSDMFLLTYGIGTALILVDSAQYGFSTYAWTQVIVLLVVALIYIQTHGKG